MNSVNPKFNLISFASILGIVFAAISLIGIGITVINWSHLYHLRIDDSINGRILSYALSFTMVAWLGELVCGFIILKHRKILGRILIAIGIFVFFFMQLLPAES